jgi:protocatechuate 3,4-dioxygenase beta subunit
MIMPSDNGTSTGHLSLKSQAREDEMNHRPNNEKTLRRRHFLGGAAAAIFVPLAAAQTTSGAVRVSPSQTLGPFYPRNASERPRETDADLLRAEGDRVLTKGVPIYLTGRVLDRRRQPLTNAAVEIWQCDANAVYHHPAGGAEADRDPNFQGYGMARTDAAGAFHFRTIKPVAYPGRTPHIHVRVQAADAAAFATQLYLADDPGNRRDFLFSRLSADEQAALTLKFEPTTAAGAPHALARATQLIARADLVIA